MNLFLNSPKTFPIISESFNLVIYWFSRDLQSSFKKLSILEISAPVKNGVSKFRINSSSEKPISACEGKKIFGCLTKLIFSTVITSS
jgi:hypothetical protein